MLRVHSHVRITLLRTVQTITVALLPPNGRFLLLVNRPEQGTMYEVLHTLPRIATWTSSIYWANSNVYMQTALTDLGLGLPPSKSPDIHQWQFPNLKSPPFSGWQYINLESWDTSWNNLNKTGVVMTFAESTCQKVLFSSRVVVNNDAWTKVHRSVVVRGQRWWEGGSWVVGRKSNYRRWNLCRYP